MSNVFLFVRGELSQSGSNVFLFVSGELSQSGSNVFWFLVNFHKRRKGKPTAK